MKQRLKAIQPHQAQTGARALLEGIEAELGMVPNLFRTMANAPAVLEAYMALSQALSGGILCEALREQIALTVSEANGSDYCVAAQAAIARAVGLTDEAIADSRRASCPDSRTAAALQFARAVVQKRGRVSDAELRAVRRVGYGDGEIAEIVANVMRATFSNYFNHVAEPEVDFPEVLPLPETFDVSEDINQKRKEP